MRESIEPAKVVEDCHELLLWLIPLLDKFPRNRRFTLGERIETGLMEVLEALTEAVYSQQKCQPSQTANCWLIGLINYQRA